MKPRSQILVFLLCTVAITFGGIHIGGHVIGGSGAHGLEAFANGLFGGAVGFVAGLMVAWFLAFKILTSSKSLLILGISSLAWICLFLLMYYSVLLKIIF